MKHVSQWLRRRKTRQRSKLYRYTNRVVTVVGIAYVLLIFFPSPLFAWQVDIGNFRIFSDRPIPSEIEQIVRRAAARLGTSPFYSGTESFHIYIANDGWRRKLLNPRASKAFGASLVFTGNTILNRADIKQDRIHNDQPVHNQRSLHQVIAHECTHHLLVGNLRLLQYLRLPEWKEEGYCEYVAGGSTIPPDEAMRLLVKAETDSSPAFRYATYHIAARECLDRRGMSVEAFFESEVDFHELLDAVVSP